MATVDMKIRAVPLITIPTKVLLHRMRREYGISFLWEVRESKDRVGPANFALVPKLAKMSRRDSTTRLKPRGTDSEIKTRTSRQTICVSNDTPQRRKLQCFEAIERLEEEATINADDSDFPQIRTPFPFFLPCQIFTDDVYGSPAQ